MTHPTEPPQPQAETPVVQALRELDCALDDLQTAWKNDHGTSSYHPAFDAVETAMTKLRAHDAARAESVAPPAADLSGLRDIVSQMKEAMNPSTSFTHRDAGIEATHHWYQKLTAELDRLEGKGK